MKSSERFVRISGIRYIETCAEVGKQAIVNRRVPTCSRRIIGISADVEYHENISTTRHSHDIGS